MPDKKKTVKKKTTKQTQKQSQTSKQVVNINLETKPKRKSRSKSSNNSNNNSNQGIKTTKQQYREYITATPSVVQVMPSNNELISSIQSILSRNQPNPVPVNMNPEMLQRLEGQLTSLNGQLQEIADYEKQIADNEKQKKQFEQKVQDFGITPPQSAFKPIAKRPYARTPTPSNMDTIKRGLEKIGNFTMGESPVRGRPAATFAPLTEEQKKARRLYSKVKQLEKESEEAGARSSSFSPYQKPTTRSRSTKN